METSSAAPGASRTLTWPLYEDLLKTPAGAERTCTVHATARPNYHFIAAASPDARVNPRGR